MPSVNGGSISGIDAGGSTLQIQDTVSNFSVNRCQLNYISIGSGFGVIPPSNILITETIIKVSIESLDDSPNSPRNVLISNCVLANLGGDIKLKANSGWEDLTCKNTIIVTSGGYMFSKIHYSLFENCILLGGSNQQYCYVGGSSNTFRNCLFFAPYSGLSPNFISENLLFNSIEVSNDGSIFNSGSYHLHESSPGKNAGKDGTDIGIYGGRYPWKDGGLPVNPHIDTFNVGGNTDTNGTLKVSIKVAAQDH